MKRLLHTALPVLALVFILQSCATTRPVAGPSGPPRSAFVGAWVLNNVSYSNLVDGSVQTIFDQAPPRDFINSTWQLTNSGNGSYTLANGATQNIYWSVNGGDALGSIFQFKKINKGESALKVTSGYQLVISNVNDNSMTLKTLVYIGSQNGYVIYTFNKTK